MYNKKWGCESCQQTDILSKLPEKGNSRKGAY